MDQLVLMEPGSAVLKSYLLAHPLPPAQILSVAVQIARGMNALAQARFVHRDLGARNILATFHGGHGKDNQQVGYYSFS